VGRDPEVADAHRIDTLREDASRPRRQERRGRECAAQEGRALHPRTSLLFSPRSGAALVIATGVSLRRTGLPTTVTLPRLGCGNLRLSPRCSTCGSSKTSLKLLSGPQGTSAARSSLSHSARGFVFTRSARIASSAS